MSEPLGTDNKVSDTAPIATTSQQGANMNDTISIKTMTTYTMPIEAIENII